MFEYQTAICELTGLPVSNASVYEGPSRGRGGGLPGEAAQRPRGGSSLSAGLHPHTIADAAHLRPRLRHGGRRGAALRDGRHRPRRVGGGDRRGHERGDLRAAELLRRRRGRRRAQRGRARRGGRRRRRARAGRRRPGRSDHARDPARRPGECGVDVAVGEGQSLGNRLDFGGPSFGFFAAREEYLRRMPGRIAGETRRRRRPARLRADAADPRAAHPPREGDVEHLHRAGAERARRRRLPVLARAARDRRAGRAAARPHRTTRARRSAALDGVEKLHEQPVVREFAAAPRRRRRRGAPPLRRAGRQPRRRPARAQRAAPRTAAGCSSRSPSGARGPTSTGSPRCSARPSPPSATAGEAVPA